MSFLCPVCGYPSLTEDPQMMHYNICPSCGVEFGLDDAHLSWDELRADWIAKGMKWWANSLYQPVNWNPEEQVKSVALPSK